MISIQILLATDRCPILIRHSGVSVGMILTLRLALRGWSSVPWHARLDRSLCLGTCKCSADLFCGAIVCLTVQYILSIGCAMATLLSWLCVLNPIENIFQAHVEDVCLRIKNQVHSKKRHISLVHIFTFNSVAGAPFCLWESIHNSSRWSSLAAGTDSPPGIACFLKFADNCVKIYRWNCFGREMFTRAPVFWLLAIKL